MAMARPHTMENGPHTTLERLIHSPPVTRQKIVSGDVAEERADEEQ